MGESNGQYPGTGGREELDEAPRPEDAGLAGWAGVRCWNGGEFIMLDAYLAVAQGAALYDAEGLDRWSVGLPEVVTAMRACVKKTGTAKLFSSLMDEAAWTVIARGTVIRGQLPSPSLELGEPTPESSGEEDALWEIFEAEELGIS